MSNRLLLAVAGAHLTGQPLNHQLTDGGAQLVMKSATSSDYELYALPTIPAKPGLRRVEAGTGSSIEVEVWSLTPEHFGSFVAALPKPMAIGKLTLIDKAEVSGFLCEEIGYADATNISEFGGWLNFLASV
jgi:allophanate hydrolase